MTKALKTTLLYFCIAVVSRSPHCFLTMVDEMRSSHCLLLAIPKTVLKHLWWKLYPTSLVASWVESSTHYHRATQTGHMLCISLWWLTSEHPQKQHVAKLQMIWSIGYSFFHFCIYPSIIRYQRTKLPGMETCGPTHSVPQQGAALLLIQWCHFQSPWAH